MDAHWSPAALAAALAYVVGGTPTSPPAGLYLGLSTTAAGTDGAGWTELAVDGYARQALSLGAPTSGTDYARVASTADITFTGLAEGAYQCVGIWDAATAGTLWYWADLDTEVTFAAGQDLVFGTGLLTVSIGSSA